MRVLLGYVDGRAVWSANTPSSAQPANWFHATLVTGGPGPAQAQREKRHRDRAAANAASRRSYAKKKAQGR